MLLILIGTGILLWVIFQIHRYRNLSNWHVVSGQINKYEIEQFKQPQVYIMANKIKPSVLYVYEIDGDCYEGSRITLEDYTLISDPESKNNQWPNFESNSDCTVYIDPKNPENSVLVQKILPYRRNHYLSLSIIGVLLILMGLYINHVSP